MNSFIASALILSTVAAILPGKVFAQNRRSAFSQQSVEALMRDYYRHVTVAETTALPGRPAGRAGAARSNPTPAPAHAPTENDHRALTEVDRNEYAVDVFDEILLLPTLQFNDVLNHALADYRQHPEHRDAIERLLRSVDVDSTTDSAADAARRAFREELNANPTSTFVKTVLDDAVMVFSAAYIFQFGRGIWRGARGVESTGLQRFRTITRYVSHSLYRGRATRWAATGVGSATGLAHAAIQAFETHRNDPRALLNTVQCGDTAPRCQDVPAENRSVVCAAAVEAASARSRIREMSEETPDQLRTHSTEYRQRVTEMDLMVTRVQREMQRLYEAAPQCRSKMEPIAEDLTHVRTTARRLILRLDGMELTGSAPL